MNRLDKQLVVRLALLIFVLAACAQDRLYVVQVMDESLARIDPGTGHVNNRVTALGYGCNDVTAAGNKLYVTNSLLNTVQEIDLRTETTIRQIPTTGGVNPYSCALLSEDTLAVTCWITNNVILLRLSDGSVIGSLTVGAGPEGIIVHGEYFYVCVTGYLGPGNYAPGVVVAYNRRTLQRWDSVRVGMNPQFAAVDNSELLHVVCTGDYANVSGEVDIINLSDMHVDTVLHIGGTPGNVSFGGDHAWLAAGGWGAEGYVYGYRLSNFAMLGNVLNPIAVGPGATDIEAQPDGSFYVSCFSADLVEHHAANGGLLGTFLMSDGPGQMVYVASPNSTPRKEVALPTTIRLLEAYPNPFNGSVRLQLSGSAITKGYINIYNEIGQLVTKLPVSPGHSEILWSPTTKSGNLLSTSVYYANWAGASAGPVIRLVYVR